MTGLYDPAGTGVGCPAMLWLASHWSSGGPGDPCDAKNGQEGATGMWSDGTTTAPATVNGGWWGWQGRKAADMTTPITLIMTSKSGVYVYTIAQPATSGQKIKPVKR